MGIRGLETFISDFYEKNPRLVQRKKLRELKLVIDGNQLPYMIKTNDRASSEGLYGGNYDQIHQRLFEILSRLKPFIECIVFDGSKELPSKAKERLKKKIYEAAGLRSSERSHIVNLLRLPPLFMRTIIINLCNELGINHYMADGFADHSVAVHANGGPEKFTVFSGDSCFYVYDLKKGYIPNTSNAIKHLFRSPRRINGNVEVPVFYLESLMRTLRIQNHVTWIYFCLFLGDQDIGLNRNTGFCNSIGVDFQAQCMPLIKYLSSNESDLIRSNFKNIRDNYQTRNLLTTVDEQLDIYQLINRDCKIVTPINGLISDFDRYVETIKKIGANFSWCCIEDCREESVVRICKNNGMLRYVYKRIQDFSTTEQFRIDEYIRTKSPSVSNPLSVEMIVVQASDRIQKLDSLINYLERINSAAQNDDFTLLLVSLSIWYEWLEENHYENDIKALHPSQSFIDAMILNYFIISIKNCANNLAIQHANQSQNSAFSQPTQHQRYQYKIKQLVDGSPKLMKDLISVYDQVIGRVKMENFQAYLNEDLRIVHRLNEFKSVYYLMGVINKLNGYQHLGLLPPHLFLNCFFQFCLIQSTSDITPMSCKPRVAKAKELHEFMFKTNGLRELIDELRSLVNSSRQELANTNTSASSTAVEVADALRKLNIQ